MQFERIESEGLAHYSYVLSDGGDAVVIDPRRDVGAYLELIKERGLRLLHVLETHRNEDYLVGSSRLAELTGAEVWHADAELDYGYGLPVEDGRRWRVGGLEVEAVHTPGHTPGHMCYLVRTEDGIPAMLFSGDCLFAGDVGRTDLMGQERLEEQTEALWRSLHERVLPLGEHVVLCPAHGPGSACGASIADRALTTIGLELELNPDLALDRTEFMRRHAVMQERPPYFSSMETRNLEPNGMPAVPWPAPLTVQEFARARREAVVLDTRRPPAFLAAHVPEALSIWKEGLGSWAGWFVPGDRPILLVSDDGEVDEVATRLARMGFDEVLGSLQGGMHSWHVDGCESERLGVVDVREAQRQMRRGDGRKHLLDVRSPGEHAEGVAPGALTIPLAELGDRLDEVPRDGDIYIFCGTGLRSTVAASLLARAGLRQVSVILGGMKGWQAEGGPQEKAA